MPSIAPFDLLTFIAGSLLSLVHLLLLAYISFAWVSVCFARESLGIKLCCFITACFWIPCALFVLLIPFGLFDRIWSTTAFVLLAGTAHLLWRKKNRPVLDPHAALGRLKKVFHDLPRVTQAATLAVFAIFLIRIARGFIAPPMAWDTLTYHLLKAGRWVQSGHWVRDNAPDSWQFYEWFPPLGDVYWAWAMLGSHSDAWIALAGGLVWLSCAPGVYVMARLLGADINRAWLAMLVALSVPASLTFVTSAYVDNTPYALSMVGSAVFIAGVGAKSTRLVATATVAFSLAVGVKITFLPFLAVGVALLALLQFCARPRQAAVLWAIPAVIVCLFWQVYLVFVGKTPFYPAPFSVLGIQIEEGMPEFIAHHYWDTTGVPYLWELGRSARKFHWEFKDNIKNHLNLTLAFPIVVILGLAGFISKLRVDSWFIKLGLTAIFMASASIFITFWAPSTMFYRLAWAYNMARFFLCFYAMLAVLGVLSSERWIKVVYLLIVAINCIFAFPRGWPWLDVQATFIGLVLMTMTTASLAFIRKGKFVFAASIATACLFLIYPIRDVYRYQFYENSSKSYDIFRVGNRLQAGAAEYLDGHRSLKIAFSGGHAGIAYRWFRYLFLGSRLQNEVVYISPTVDGSTYSHGVLPMKQLSYEFWRKRALQYGLDYFVAIEPYPIELEWIIEDKQRYELALTQPGNHWVVIGLKPNSKEKAAQTTQK